MGLILCKLEMLVLPYATWESNESNIDFFPFLRMCQRQSQFWLGIERSNDFETIFQKATPVNVQAQTISTRLSWWWEDDSCNALTKHQWGWKKKQRTMTQKLNTSPTISMWMLRIHEWGARIQDFVTTTWIIWLCTFIMFIWIKVYHVVLFGGNRMLIGNLVCVIYA